MNLVTFSVSEQCEGLKFLTGTKQGYTFRLKTTYSLYQSSSNEEMLRVVKSKNLAICGIAVASKHKSYFLSLHQSVTVDS